MAEENQDAAFDKIMEKVGDNGLFQKKFNLIFNVGLVLCASMSYMNIVLALSVPDHWCHVPGQETTNYTQEEWKNLTLPREMDNRGVTSYQSCSMYNKRPNETTNWDENANETTICSHGYDYDTQWYKRTVISQEDWVCDKSLYETNTFVFTRVGEVVGTFVFGQLGDTLGRRWVYYVSLICVVVGRIMSILTSSNFYLFATAAVIGSLTSNSVFQSTLIIAMETSKSDDRAHIAMVQSLGWTVGMCLMPVILWITGDWITFLLITSLPQLIFIGFYKFMIESPRWLANKRRFPECVKQLNTIAKINKNKIRITEEELIEALPKGDVETVYGIMSLFTHWRLAKNTMLIIVCWLVCSQGYFVLVLNASKMGGNPFLNFIYQSAIELPAYLVGRVWGDRLGRRFTTCISFTLASIGCVLVVLVSHDVELQVYTTCFSVFIKFCISLSFYIVNLLSMETYPTCLRQTGISIGSITGNLFGVLGPYVVLLGTNYDVRYPFLIIGALAVIGAIASLFLPETLHQKLPETLAEAQRFGANQAFWKLPKVQKEDESEIKLNQKKYAP